MKINEFVSYLEDLAPVNSQEVWDNCGVQTGDVTLDCSGILVALDCTEAVVLEAISKGCNLVITHHPLIFKGLKQITGKNYVERTLLLAIKNDVTLYAIHTNFDVWRFGVNHEIANRLSLIDQRIFVPATDSLVKVEVYVPSENSSEVQEAMFNAGAGRVGDYSDCSFQSAGLGTFVPNASAKPFVGEAGITEKVNEVKIEAIVARHSLNAVIKAMLSTHPYEEVAHHIIPTVNKNNYQGLGMIGTFETAKTVEEFLILVKNTFGGTLRYTGNIENKIKTIALCGGAGASFISNAKASKVDAYLTADVKYHEFFDAENALLLVDIGHFESEQFTSHRIVSLLKEKFTNFAVHLTDTHTNPIKYF
jgi:dinuclear metal center YbgI/SA1388 family protein